MSEKNSCVIFDGRKPGKNIFAPLSTVGKGAEKLFRASRLLKMGEENFYGLPDRPARRENISDHSPTVAERPGKVLDASRRSKMGQKYFFGVSDGREADLDEEF